MRSTAESSRSIYQDPFISMQLMKMKLLPLLFIFLVASIREIAVSEDDGRELERQIKFMDKAPIKTTLTAERDVYDCFDIDKQPALEHPLLKGHKVQKEPNLHFKRFDKAPANVNSAQLGLKEPCPVGTVPILRATKEVLKKEKSLPNIPSLAAMKQNGPSNQHVVSLVDNKISNVKFGIYATLSIYNLTVAHDQFSSHNVWIETGSADHINMMAAGWQVFPQLYGDTHSRLFIYWTGDGYRNGCYNTLCPGFVQVDRRITTGAPFSHSSTYGGDQYEFSILIQQDRATGNWWLVLDDDPPVKVGYWPKELFLYLRNGSLHSAWGGVGLAGGNGVCPPMGSGHMPDRDFTHATYFRQLFWIDGHGDYSDLPGSKDMREWVDKSKVYGLKNHHFVGIEMQYAISYGGPGGYCRG